MIIHLAAGRASIPKDIDLLRQIVSVIHRHGHVLARDWIEPQYYISKNPSAKEIEPQEVYKQSIDAIERSDLVIVEGSEKSFSSGVQLATALHKKKPTLLLVDKQRVAQESPMAQGMQDPLLVRAEYDTTTLQSIVHAFVEENTVTTKDLRFNFVIDRQIYNHIKWRSFKTKKTKAEVLRELLIKDMENNKD